MSFIPNHTRVFEPQRTKALDSLFEQGLGGAIQVDRHRPVPVHPKHFPPYPVMYPISASSKPRRFTAYGSLEHYPLVVGIHMPDFPPPAGEHNQLSLKQRIDDGYRAQNSSFELQAVLFRSLESGIERIVFDESFPFAAENDLSVPCLCDEVVFSEAPEELHVQVPVDPPKGAGCRRAATRAARPPRPPY